MRATLSILLSLLATSLVAQQPRHFLPPLVPVATIGGAANDVLMQPAFLLTDSDGVIVYDGGDQTIRRFGLDGKVRWTAGRTGSGPGEYQHVGGMQFDAGGNLWVADAENARITVLAPGGKLVRTIPLRQPAWQVEPIGGGAFLTDSPDSAHFILRRTDSSAAPIPVPVEVAAVPPLARQCFLARTGNRNVAAFAFSGLFYLFDNAGHFQAVHGIEPVPFPEITHQAVNGGYSTTFAKRPVFAAMSVAAAGDSLYILFAGAGELRGQVVDVYSTADGHYFGSYRLPARAAAIAAGKGGLAVLTQDPVPMVTVFGARGGSR